MSVATSDEQGMRNWAGDRVCTEGCIIIIYFVGSSRKRPDNDNHQDNNVNTRRVHLKFVLERRDKDWTGDG